jgi:LuxR family maltose regulon positive regulatory protein
VVKTSREKRHHPGILFSPERISRVLDGIFDYPLTIVEAPMGYGKTTAVRERLKTAGARVLWQRVDHSSTVSFWNDFCRLFSAVDDDRSLSLARLELPDDSVSRREAARLIEQIELSVPTILVIDDYHLVDSPEVNGLIELLTESEIGNLGIVLVTRFTSFPRLEELSLKGYLLHLTKELLEFTPEEITGYYRACGIRLTDVEAGQLHAATEGWISALYLFMLEYSATGGYNPAKSVYRLLEEAVYAPLAGEMKEFVLTMCIFDSFTYEQALHMWGRENTAGLLAELTGRSAFVTYDSPSGTYRMHGIFSGFLKEILLKEDTARRQDLYRRAAEWHQGIGEHAAVRRYFYQCGDFDSILLSLEQDRSNDYSAENKELLKQYLAECPVEVKARHHNAMLIFALHLFVHNERELFGQVCGEFRRNIAADASLDEDLRHRLLGEFELLLSFTAYNDLKRMSAYHRKAYALLKRPTSLYDRKVNWSFGSPSVLCLYYRESGKLAEAVADLQEALPCYTLLTYGHGAGAGEVMDAERYFHMGDLNNAEISVHKALAGARSHHEKNIVLCATYLQARLAFARGDFPGMFDLLSQMRADMTSRKDYHFLHMVEICEGSIYANLDQKDRIPRGLLEGGPGSVRLRFPAVPMFNIMYGRVLLINAAYLKLIGSADSFLSLASVFPNLLGQIYTHIYLAAANREIFREEETLASLRRALDIALPDRVYMPFVENGDYIAPLLERLAGECGCRDGIARILALYGTYRRNKERIIREYFTETRPQLTPREMEIARLAATGITNAAIGKQLQISSNTVKMAIKNIYAKLAVNNRALLARRLADPDR